MRGAREIKPMGIRMPPEMREQLKEKAIKNHRSLGGEILFRLEESLRQEEKDKNPNEEKKNG